MHLKRLEIIGFKSFARRSILEFPKPKKGDLSIAAIVGPNGVGKSNLVESIRWALGEQSLKSLRGKKLQDIIFSGSIKKTRLNLAEVTLFFNNEDGAAPIDYKEFTITRRIYRNGESEYLINKSKVRLQDILILLAKSNFGQKSYSVVSQGMVDQILQASPLERKRFFDEATGIKQYQIKKDDAFRKIEKSQINLQQANIALSEIFPHLRSLTRQINKLEKRQEIEVKLVKLQNKYYGAFWQTSNEEIFILNKKINQETQEQKQIEETLKNVQKQSEALVYEKIDEQYEKIQKDYQQTLEEKNKYLGEQSMLQAQLSFQRQLNQEKEEKFEIKLDEEKLLFNLKKLKSEQKEFLNKIEKISQIKELEKIKNIAKIIYEKIILCLKQFEIEKNPKTTSINSKKRQLIKDLEEKKEKIDKNIKKVDSKLKEINQELNEFNEKEREKRKKLLDWQKNVQEKQSKLNQFTYKINEFKIDLARLETKNDILEKEINEEMGAQGKEIMKIRKDDVKIRPEPEDLEKIYKLKHQLELIGSIDPEVTKEYPEVNQRYKFLNSQSNDLTKSLKGLNKIIQELDEKIKEQFKENFSQINKMFDRYFKIIFGGGNAKIILQKQEQESQKTEEEQEPLIKNRIIDGIDIFATPPGKKIKSIEMLSGGEKALTSLSLICAIISINKPPFVVLDEVDAALDQENSFRFGKILQELRRNSQFIIITHNQQTIESADILYGITMDSDSISRLISLKLEE